MQTQGVVLDNVVNLYSKPSTAVEVVTQAILGTEVSILETKEGWYHVRLPDHYQGWIESHAVRVYGPDQAPYASEGQVAEVKHLLAFLHRAPEATFRAPALQITLSARLEVAGQHESWVQVSLPDGSLRWMRSGDVVIANADATRSRQDVQQVLDTAKRFLGLPYMWGGTTPLGIDCSGFVQLVYRLNGVSLLRDADIQFTQPDLKPVEKEQLQAGDLLFFGQEAITHVGMFIGNGEFIHATTHIKPIVQISRLDEPHWTDRYRGARRP